MMAISLRRAAIVACLRDRNSFWKRKVVALINASLKCFLLHIGLLLLHVRLEFGKDLFLFFLAHYFKLLLHTRTH